MDSSGIGRGCVVHFSVRATLGPQSSEQSSFHRPAARDNAVLAADIFLHIPLVGPGMPDPDDLPPFAESVDRPDANIPPDQRDEAYFLAEVARLEAEARRESFGR